MYRLLVLLSFVFFNQGLPAQNEEPVILHTATGDLYGSLILPANRNKFDLVILQAGSGPTDRKGNNPLGVNADSYWMLAHELVKNNIATLLFDKRGIAASKEAGRDESKLVFDDYIKDLEDWVALFKKDKRIENIILAGHSEGSLIAMVAAQKIKVARYISIAGPAKPIDEIISWQLKQQAPVLAAPADSLFNRLRKGEKIDSIPPLLFSLFRPSIQPYMISWMKYSPCAEIKKLTVPVLIIQGSQDYQVQQSEGEALRACDPQARFSLIPEMNHVLKRSPGNFAEDRATYTQPALPIVQQLVTEIVSFIKK
ncbi:alpha/beta fold hydrolase [Niabella yanshanensis]|uniref:Alpha/beta fold hydrolase n=1 Tax=Niabella yanshanensis TaxID=577386 RepID=A0ABZ0W3P7_9BACT|nr:alpha/beta fold hydrolase [Niabella yanshanensis]WQD36701.1 alpha/beta fold hydrolase [Niabella yanshanensis]